MTTFRYLARFYKALGDETRLQLVALLARQQPGHALCVGRLAHDLGVTPSAVSQHLRVLKDLGLVQANRQGYRIHYYLDSERLATYQALARDSLGMEFVLIAAGNPDSHAEDGDMCCCEQQEVEQTGE
jgi:DNA-binding transcriptional ArsR family regulator